MRRVRHNGDRALETHWRRVMELHPHFLAIANFAEFHTVTMFSIALSFHGYSDTVFASILYIYRTAMGNSIGVRVRRLPPVPTFCWLPLRRRAMEEILGVIGIMRKSEWLLS